MLLLGVKIVVMFVALYGQRSHAALDHQQAESGISKIKHEVVNSFTP